MTGWRCRRTTGPPSTVRGGPPMSEPMVKAEQVRKRFGRLEVLKGISLEVAPRRGHLPARARPARASRPSCAASTTWRRSTPAASGSTASWSATGRSANKLYELRESEVARERAEIGMVFQRFNLFPHMTAIENVIEAPIRVKGVAQGAKRVERGRELLERVGLERQDRRVPGAPLRRPAAAASRSPGRWRWSRS